MFKHLVFATLTLTAALLSPLQNVWAQEGDVEALSPQGQLEEDLALFWGQEREVKVVQRRSFIKDGKMEATVFGGIVPNDEFIFYITPGVRFGYHFTESFMVEGSFVYMVQQDTDLKSFLETSDIGLKSADIREKIKNNASVNILWSPLYGKINFLGTKLTHFDTFLGFGVGVVQTSAREQDINPDFQDLTKVAANTVLGFRWHISELMNVRTEYRHYFFEKAIGGVSKPVELTLGLGFSF